MGENSPNLVTLLLAIKLRFLCAEKGSKVERIISDNNVEPSALIFPRVEAFTPSVARARMSNGNAEICSNEICSNGICPNEIYPNRICQNEICPKGICPNRICPNGIFSVWNLSELPPDAGEVQEPYSCV
jgi:hypothetical protein